MNRFRTQRLAAAMTVLLALTVFGAEGLAQTAAATTTGVVYIRKVLGVFPVDRSGLGVTSTDGVTLTNSTAATVGTPVQISPRLKWCGTAYNSTSTLSETDCMFAEVLPATVAGTTTSTLKFGAIIAGGAATYPMTVSSAGAVLASSFAVGSATPILSGTAPTISSGFGTGAALQAVNGPAAFALTVGTGGVATAGVIGLPTVAGGWTCNVFNATARTGHRADNTVQTANTVSSVTFENQTTSTGAAVAWTASDQVRANCFPF